MPLTVIDIERRQKWRIGLLYCILLLIYLFMTLAVYACILLVTFPFAVTKNSLFGATVMQLIVVMLGAVMIATLHFWLSATSVLKSVVKMLNAVPPDTGDSVHMKLTNVMQEVRLLTGKRKIDCLVVPSLSMNALAASDLKGDAVIAITEGLLSRLTRPQLEAVIAHETYHIMSGDCIESTIATSFFGMYASFFEKLESWADDGRETSFHLGFLSVKGLLSLSNLLSMFISREREYRADAAAVRMTRNPVALAEALHIVSRNWNGSGLISSGLEMLCIASPEPDPYDESDTWLADLLSTHPPMKKRIRKILYYAHKTFDAFEQKQDEKSKDANRGEREEDDRYYALDPKQQWQGPFSLAVLCSLPWITPMTWLSDIRGHDAFRASEDDLVGSSLTMRMGETPSGYTCPNCRHALSKTDYEGTHVHQCSSCGGTLVENDKIPRIIARRERKCTERVRAFARAVLRDNQHAMTIKKLKKTAARTLSGPICSKCGNVMFRTFYSGAYLIEVDRCNICGITWFDADELEMLQCLIENKITGTLV